MCTVGPSISGTIYCTIQAAITASVNGDIIDVPSGTYTESLIINKEITILGPNSAISPNGGSRSSEAIIDLSGGSTHEINLKANNIVLKGLKIINSNNAGAIMAGTFSSHSIVDNILIEKNIFDSLTGSGIASILYTYTGKWIIKDNYFSNLASGSFYGGTYGHGIFLWGGLNCEISNNYITNSLIGISVGFLQGSTIASNTINNSKMSGINYFQKSSSVTITLNQVNNANTDLIKDEAAIRISGDATGEQDLQITNNIFKNSYNGFLVDAQVDITNIFLKYNQISNNNNFLIINSASGTLKAMCNYYALNLYSQISPLISGTATIMPNLVLPDSSSSTIGFQTSENCKYEALISVDSFSDVVVGQLQTYTVTVTPAVSGSPSITGTYTFFVNGGVVSSNIPLINPATRFYGAVGTYNVKFTYSGDGNFRSTTSSVLVQNVLIASSVTNFITPPDVTYGDTITYSSLI